MILWIDKMDFLLILTLTADNDCLKMFAHYFTAFADKLSVYSRIFHTTNAFWDHKLSDH